MLGPTRYAAVAKTIHLPFTNITLHNIFVYFRKKWRDALSYNKTAINTVNIKTSCARGDTICLLPLQVDNIFVFIRQAAPVPVCWLFKTETSATSWPFDLESGVRVTCDVGYLCASFSLPRPLCFRLRPDVPDIQTDRQTSDIQTDVRQKHRLMPPPYGGGGIIIEKEQRLPNNSPNLNVMRYHVRNAQSHFETIIRSPKVSELHVEVARMGHFYASPSVQLTKLSRVLKIVS